MRVSTKTAGIFTIVDARRALDIYTSILSDRAKATGQCAISRADGRTAVIGSRSDEKRSMTASARIHEALRERIVSLELPPGSVLPEKEFAESFGVSRTPVREALLRLGEEQLVDIYPQIGTFVAPIRVSVVLDAMVIRDALERFAVRAAAARAGEAEIAALNANLARQRSAAASGDIAAFHSADEAMHQLIANIAGHPNIWRVVKREKANVDRMRLLSLHLAGRFETVIAEHARIVKALREHRPDAAEAAMQAHLGRVAPSLEASREMYPAISRTRPRPRLASAASIERRARARSCCIPIAFCLRTQSSARLRVGSSSACAICRSSRRTATPIRVGLLRTSRSITRLSFLSRPTTTSTACFTARG